MKGANDITNWFKSLPQDKQALFSAKLKKELFAIAKNADDNKPSEPKIIEGLPKVNDGLTEEEKLAIQAEELRLAKEGE